MEFKKSIIALAILFSAFSVEAASNSNTPFTTDECKPFVQLNKTMKANLEMTDGQLEAVMKLNKHFLISRKQILNTPDKIGQNTALLACWDQWRTTLSESLTNPQMEKFMEWQSQVDLLGNKPF